MIQTKIPAYYELYGVKKDIVHVEIIEFTTNKQGKVYTRQDFRINEDGGKEIINIKRDILYSNEKLIQTDAYIEQNFDFTGLNSVEKEWKKIQIALFLDVTTNPYENGKTIYKLTPSDWEMTE